MNNYYSQPSKEGMLPMVRSDSAKTPAVYRPGEATRRSLEPYTERQQYYCKTEIYKLTKRSNRVAIVEGSPQDREAAITAIVMPGIAEIPKSPFPVMVLNFRGPTESNRLIEETLDAGHGILHVEASATSLLSQLPPALAAEALAWSFKTSSGDTGFDPRRAKQVALDVMTAISGPEDPFKSPSLQKYAYALEHLKNIETPISGPDTFKEFSSIANQEIAEIVLDIISFSYPQNNQYKSGIEAEMEKMDIVDPGWMRKFMNLLDSFHIYNETRDQLKTEALQAKGRLQEQRAQLPPTLDQLRRLDNCFPNRSDAKMASAIESNLEQAKSLLLFENPGEDKTIEMQQGDLPAVLIFTVPPSRGIDQRPLRDLLLECAMRLIAMEKIPDVWEHAQPQEVIVTGAEYINADSRDINNPMKRFLDICEDHKVTTILSYGLLTQAAEDMILTTGSSTVFGKTQQGDRADTVSRKIGVTPQWVENDRIIGSTVTYQTTERGEKAKQRNQRRHDDDESSDSTKKTERTETGGTTSHTERSEVWREETHQTRVNMPRVSPWELQSLADGYMIVVPENGSPQIVDLPEPPLYSQDRPMSAVIKDSKEVGYLKGFGRRVLGLFKNSETDNSQ